MLNITDDYDTYNSCTNNEIKYINIITKSVLVSIPTLTLIDLVKNTMIEHLKTSKG